MNENSHSTTINSWLARASRQLVNVGIKTAQLDAEVILAHTLRKPRTWLHAHNDAELEPRAIDIAQARLDLRLDRVPLAYIVGHKEFYGYNFRVSTATLIPRPESESLIDLLQLTSANSFEEQNLVDVGTGSGALGIVSKLKYPHLNVTLVDKSRHALAVAEKNSQDLQAQVSLLESDLLESYPQTADIIIANLPYVNPEWERSPETEHEPVMALFAEDNGLALIKKLIQQTLSKLEKDGSLILEADPEQHDAIKAAAQEAGLILVKIDGYGLLFEKLR